MRAATRHTGPQALVAVPLFHWPELQRLAALDDDRRRLMARAAALPPASHRRIVLEARIAELTARLLAAEIGSARG